jgi:hypothetical protein
LLVEHTNQLNSLDEAKMAERMTTAEMMREYNRMRLERGDSSASAPAARGNVLAEYASTRVTVAAEAESIHISSASAVLC